MNDVQLCNPLHIFFTLNVLLTLHLLLCFVDFSGTRIFFAHFPNSPTPPQKKTTTKALQKRHQNDKIVGISDLEKKNTPKNTPRNDLPPNNLPALLARTLAAQIIPQKISISLKNSMFWRS